MKSTLLYLPMALTHNFLWDCPFNSFNKRKYEELPITHLPSLQLDLPDPPHSIQIQIKDFKDKNFLICL